MAGREEERRAAQIRLMEDAARQRSPRVQIPTATLGSQEESQRYGQYLQEGYVPPMEHPARMGGSGAFATPRWGGGVEAPRKDPIDIVGMAGTASKIAYRGASGVIGNLMRKAQPPTAATTDIAEQLLLKRAARNDPGVYPLWRDRKAWQEKLISAMERRRRWGEELNPAALKLGELATEQWAVPLASNSAQWQGTK